MNTRNVANSRFSKNFCNFDENIDSSLQKLLNIIISQIYCIFVYTSKRQKDHVSTTMGTKILVPRTLKKKENNIVIVGWSSSS